MPVKDGPACPGCSLPNYSGLCPVCRGDERAAREERMPYPWRDADLSEMDPMPWREPEEDV